MSHELTEYENQLKEEWVVEEVVTHVTKHTCSAVLKIKGGYELGTSVTDNRINEDLTVEELRDKAIKQAYECLEDFDRFYRKTKNNDE